MCQGMVWNQGKMKWNGKEISLLNVEDARMERKERFQEWNEKLVFHTTVGFAHGIYKKNVHQ